MAPTIVYLKGKPVFAVGAAGGRTIPMQVTKTLIAHLDWGLSAREALAEPVIYYNKEGLVVEQGTRLETMIPALEKLGHKVSASRLPLKANAAEKTPAGWVGAADPRSVGTALAE
jgi:gamma-glutamyltranspeptidase/glutathione hydrolase